MKQITSLFARLLVASLLSLTALPTQADDWPQRMGPQRDGVWRETSIVEKHPTNAPMVALVPGVLNPSLRRDSLLDHQPCVAYKEPVSRRTTVPTLN